MRTPILRAQWEKLLLLLTCEPAATDMWTAEDGMKMKMRNIPETYMV
jgi:hypothetical protein